MALTGLLGFLRPPDKKQPKKLFITEVELENIKEQKRILQDAMKASKMLSVSYNLALKNLTQKYELPDDFILNFETGEVEKSDG